MAEELLASDPDAAPRSCWPRRATASSTALAELRDLVRGIHPPVLADRGLVGAVQALALAAPDADRPCAPTSPSGCRRRWSRPPTSRVAEALTNVVKHSERDARREIGVHRTPDDGCSSASATTAAAARDPTAGQRTARDRAAAGGLRRHAARRQPARRADLGWLWSCRARCPRRRPCPPPGRPDPAAHGARLRGRRGRRQRAVAAAGAARRTAPTSRSWTSGCRRRSPTRACARRSRPGSRCPGLPVLVLSQYVEQLYARELLADRSGGVGYLLKDRVSNVEQFVDAVRQVAGGGTAMDPEVVAQLLDRRAADGPLAALTPREREVLALMAEGRSNAAIAGTHVHHARRRSASTPQHLQPARPAAVRGRQPPGAGGARVPRRRRLARDPGNDEVGPLGGPAGAQVVPLGAGRNGRCPGARGRDRCRRGAPSAGPSRRRARRGTPTGASARVVRRGAGRRRRRSRRCRARPAPRFVEPLVGGQAVRARPVAARSARTERLSTYSRSRA